MVAEWDTDISATFLIFRLKSSTDAAFFKVLGKLFHKGTRRKRSFVSNKWCLVWAGSAFPQSFLSYKQSEAERKDFEDIPEQGHSWFLYIIQTFYFFRRRYSLSQSRMERRWFELVSKGNLVITLAARFCYFWRLSLK